MNSSGRSRVMVPSNFKETSSQSFETGQRMASLSAVDTSTNKPKPPVVQPGTGNNIIINPRQVSSIHALCFIPEFHSQIEVESGPRVHPECWERVWRDFARLPGRKDDRCVIPQVSACATSNACIYTTYCCPYSLRYHRLHPEYIHQRIEALGYAYNLRVLLLMCDIVCAILQSRGSRDPDNATDRTPRSHSRTDQSLSTFILSQSSPSQ